ncbi:MAG: YlxR family protein [Thermoleophilum sp.]|nr:YlxR family protein [Thermoleophilum sp.]
MCVVCRRRAYQDELLRLALADGRRVVADPERRQPGRGAYVCGSPQCGAGLAKAERALARAFRAAVELPQETIDFVHEWQRSASIK